MQNMQNICKINKKTIPAKHESSKPASLLKAKTHCGVQQGCEGMRRGTTGDV